MSYVLIYGSNLPVFNSSLVNLVKTGKVKSILIYIDRRPCTHYKIKKALKNNNFGENTIFRGSTRCEETEIEHRLQQDQIKPAVQGQLSFEKGLISIYLKRGNFETVENGNSS